MLSELEKVLNEEANSEKAKILQGFFKTGRGQYGERDIFLGISVPKQRVIAKQFGNLDFEEIQKLLNSKIHERRLIALLILVERFSRGDENLRKKVFDFYLNNTKNINNWDLVDLSAYQIVGNYLLDKPRNVLIDLANSKELWEKRISIVSCFAFIRKNEFEDCLRISEILLGDEHDLIHKAVGWMLREVGKRDVETLRKFLRKNYSFLSRTTLRYSIEKFSEEERKKWLAGNY
jgi:3-methyladenine DNA glycosylase AlkD